MDGQLPPLQPAPQASTRREATSLAFDIETYCVNHSKEGALSPFTGEIRLVSTADVAGNITLRDLKDNPADQELVDMLRDAELVIHQAAFELRFLGVKLGVVLEQVFCTRTADWILFPRKGRIHDLGSVLERYLGVKIPKELGGSDWGGLVLTEEQIEYAKNDVRYLLPLKGVLSEKLEAAGLTRIFELESRLLPIIARMEIHGFAVDTARMREMREAARKKADAIAVELRIAFDNPKLNPGSTKQLMAAFEATGVKLENTERGNPDLPRRPQGQADSRLEGGSQARLEHPNASQCRAWRADSCHLQPVGDGDREIQ